MFPRILNFVGDVAEYDALDQSVWIIELRSRGCGVHRVINQSM